MRNRIVPAAALAAALVIITAATALPAGFPGREKILDPDLLESTAKSLNPVPVIVTLTAPGPSAGLSDKALQRRIRKSVTSAMTRMAPADGRPHWRLENSPVFTAGVTEKGLRTLAGLDAVAAIEADRPLILHTAQGIPLMRPGAYRGQGGGRGVAVAIVDTGVDYTHPALGGGGFPNRKVIGGFDIGENDPDPMDNHGHGTACAAIAAGTPTGASGYLGGVAPEARIYALKITAADRTIMTSGALRAWDWCVSHANDDPDHPIVAISTSIGTPMRHWRSHCKSPSLDSVAQAANRRGIAIFVSSGNEAQSDGISKPACIAGSIAVGAVYDADIGSVGFSTCRDGRTGADRVTCYSNSAPILDLLAPAHNATTATYPGRQYRTDFGGTSAACPYAAGAAALIQGVARNRTGRFLDVEALRSLMVRTGQRVTDPKSGLARNRVRIEPAVNAIGPGDGGGDGEDDEDDGRDGDAPIDILRDILKDAK